MGSTTVTENKMPEFQEAFLSGTVIPQAQKMLATPFTPYEGQRAAEMTPLQQQVLQKFGALDTGGQQFGQAAQTYGDLASFGAPQAEAARVGPAMGIRSVGQVGDVQAGQLSGTDIGSYMSPYTEQVTNAALRQLGGAQDIALNQMGAEATRAGAFGGSRHGVAEAETRKAYGQQVADLIAQQQQQAFLNAQQAAQFDIGQRASSDALNQQAAEAAAAREQAARSGNVAAANQFAMQQAQYEQAANLANQQAALSAAGIRAGGAAGLGATAGQALESQLAGLQAQTGAGELERAIKQAELDMAYQNYLAQQQYPLTQFGVLTGAAGAIPAGYGTTSQTQGGVGYALQAIGAAGKGIGAMMNPAGAAAGGGGLMSDARLKDDVTKVGEINGVNLYRWKWNDEAKQLGADGHPETGVMAQEIEATHPQHVHIGADGYRRVNYVGLFNELEVA
jgi:hypothetical protein